MNETHEEVLDEVKLVESKKTRPYEIISLVSFIMCFVAIIFAIIVDLTSFKEVILNLIAAIIVPSILFMMLTVLFFASFVFIFGFYLVKIHGFWPTKITISFFKEILKDIVFAPNDKTRFMTLRIVLIAICALILVSAIISKILKNIDVKKNSIKPKLNNSKLSTTAIILSSLGIIVSIGAIVMFSKI